MNAHPLGYMVDPVAGLVYGKLGKPIRRIAGRYIALNIKGVHIAYAHRVVWEAVHGDIPDGLQVNHINGVRTDNRIENLELVTPGENSLHAYRIGLQRADGTHNGRAKLTVAQVREIRESNERLCVLSREYGVDQRTISDIKNGRRWGAALARCQP